ncbi:hypothetical protein NHJ13734_009706 [Beauveria thailandica]
MKFLTQLLPVFIAGILNPVAADSVPYEKLNVNDTVLVVVDHQVGLFNLARDAEPGLFFRNMVTHAAIGKLFDVPVVMTTSYQDGPNGPLLDEILDMYPNGTLIQRPGQIDAWDNPDFQAAIRGTGRKQIVLAGVTTDVCTTFLALSLRAAGYSVWANVEASGTTSTLLRDVSNSRMQAAGVQLVGVFSIIGDLFRDWRNTSPNATELAAWLDKYAPEYGMSARLFNAAKGNSTK